MNARELRDQRASVLASAKSLVEAAEKENRDLKPEEQKSYDDFLSEAESLEKRYTRLEAIPEPTPVVGQKAPNYNNKTKLGDSEVRALAFYVKTGDLGAVRGMTVEGEDRDGKPQVEIRIPTAAEMRAVTDSTMNITTAADGQNLVPTGFAGKIATRRAEIRLAEKLGVQKVPGKGTTVNYPYDNADAQDFTTTAEQADAHTTAYTRDALQVGLKAFTLVKKTKKVELTEELLEDEDANIMDFVANKIGTGVGLTHNAALIAEVVASGTLLKTTASATAIAAGEPDACVYNDTMSFYLDDGGSIHWVMRPATFGAIKALAGDPRVYGSVAGQGKALLEYPVEYSSKVAAIAASAKVAHFGNWAYMGLYESPSLTLLRDPYSVEGMVVLKYSFRLCYGQLIAGAIGYMAMAAGT
ncbi:MAG: phage major capsid protein [Anaerolineaceae bacterium]